VQPAILTTLEIPFTIYKDSTFLELTHIFDYKNEGIFLENFCKVCIFPNIRFLLPENFRNIRLEIFATYITIFILIVLSNVLWLNSVLLLIMSCDVCMFERKTVENGARK